MLVKKIFNNNVLLAEEASQELIVIGRGVGFQQKIGGQIDVSKIEKSYCPQDDQWIKLFNELTDSISSEYIEIASHIITMAEEHLATTFDDYLLIGLADHIQYAVTRWQSKLPIKNELLWETQHFYPEEYHIGELAVDYIATRLNIKLPVDEVGFIALKFVEKRNGPQENERATQIIQLIEGILTIIPVMNYSNPLITLFIRILGIIGETFIFLIEFLELVHFEQALFLLTYERKSIE